MGTGTFGVMLFLVYYMQTDLGYSAIESGVALLPMLVFTAVGANVSAVKLMPKYGPRPLVTAGLLLSAAGMAWLTGIGIDSGYASHLMGPVTAVGLGLGLIYGAALRTGTAGVALKDTGIASACVSTGQQLGGAIGTALLNTIAATATGTWFDDHVQGTPTARDIHLASIHGYTTVFWWCTAVFVAGALIAGLMLRSGPLPAPRHPRPPSPPPSPRPPRPDTPFHGRPAGRRHPATSPGAAGPPPCPPCACPVRPGPPPHTKDRRTEEPTMTTTPPAPPAAAPAGFAFDFDHGNFYRDLIAAAGDSSGQQQAIAPRTCPSSSGSRPSCGPPASTPWPPTTPPPSASTPASTAAPPPNAPPTATRTSPPSTPPPTSPTRSIPNANTSCAR